MVEKEVNNKVKELVERVRLTPGETDKAFDDAFDEPIEFDHKPTPEEIIAVRLKAVADAATNKVLKEDLALIDREKGTPYDIFHGLFEEYSIMGCCRGAINQWPTEYQDEFWGVFANRIDETVIPLRETIKDKDND